MLWRGGFNFNFWPSLEGSVIQTCEMSWILMGIEILCQNWGMTWRMPRRSKSRGLASLLRSMCDRQEAEGIEGWNQWTDADVRGGNSGEMSVRVCKPLISLAEATWMSQIFSAFSLVYIQLCQQLESWRLIWPGGICNPTPPKPLQTEKEPIKIEKLSHVLHLNTPSLLFI